MEPLEFYVLCESRSTELAKRFLDTFLPFRIPVAEDFPFPQYEDDSKAIFQTPEELMKCLEENKDEGYSFYWNSQCESGPDQAMLFYTEDGAMIVGLSGVNLAPADTLKKISKQVEGRYGYFTIESCPPNTRDEFIEICRESTLTNLFDGWIRNKTLS